MPIVLWQQPVLHARAAEVTEFDAALADLVEELSRTMRLAPGAGLAAPQVGVGLRVFVYDCGVQGRGHVVNPVLERLPGGLQDGEEGCLSLPDLFYPTVRAEEVVVRGVDVSGEPVTIEGRGYLARCLQHETDHLDGTLYVERLGGKLRRQALRDIAAAPWNGQESRPVGP